MSNQLEDILSKAVNKKVVSDWDAKVIETCLKFLAQTAQVHPNVKREMDSRHGKQMLDDLFDMLEEQA